MTADRIASFLAVGLALVGAVLVGTYAWVMQYDSTILNRVDYKTDSHEYDVELVEEFTEWVNKDVYARNLGDKNVIVRIRFEELINGSGNGGSEGRGIENQGIYKTSTAWAGNTDRSDITKGLVKYVFGSNVITMEEWRKRITGLSSEHRLEQLQDKDGNGFWVIDTDGWCYYTKALEPDETSAKLLDNVEMGMTDDEIFPLYGHFFKMDYKLNVRLQAMSADLWSYDAPYDADGNLKTGSDAPTDRTMWSNTSVNSNGSTGKEILKSDINTVFEILDDATLTYDAHMLVTDTAVKSGYMPVKNMAEVEISDEGIKLVKPIIDLTDWGKQEENLEILMNSNYYIPETNTFRFPDYTIANVDGKEEYLPITEIGDNFFADSWMFVNMNLILPNGLKRIGDHAFDNCLFGGTLTIPATVEYIGEGAYTNNIFDELIFEGANRTNLTKAPGEPDSLVIKNNAFAYCEVHKPVDLPSRTSEIGEDIFQLCYKFLDDGTRAYLDTVYVPEGCPLPVHWHYRNDGSGSREYITSYIYSKSTGEITE